jgi:hypothetical protein
LPAQVLLYGTSAINGGENIVRILHETTNPGNGQKTAVK